MNTLEQILDARTRPGDLYVRLDDENNIRCFACGLRCLIREGRRGVCRVRYSEGGVLKVPWNYVAALQVDPTAKKPLFHVLPGSRSVTFGMLGCDLHCDYCQNWITSQALRDKVAGIGPSDVTVSEIIQTGRKRGAQLAVSSYNEPLITSEWAVEIFKAAKAQGLATAFVSNGNATPQALDYLRPWLDIFKIDLKTMSGRKYRKLGGVLEHVLEAIRMTFERGFWLEVVTLVVPGFNDSNAELHEAAEFIASVSIDIPWHVIAFRKHYRMQDPAATQPADLKRAAKIGREAGLRFVYAGNLPGRVGDLENTYCPECNRLLIERAGVVIARDDLSLTGGRCPGCGTMIAGFWKDGVDPQRHAATSGSDDVVAAPGDIRRE